MECDICSQHDVARVGMFCATCVRSSIYPLRLEAVEILTARQKIGGTIDDIAADRSVKMEDQRLHSVWQAEVHKIAAAGTKEKIVQQRQHIEVLKAKIKEMRAEAAEDRIHLERRRADLEAIKTRLTSRQHEHLTQTTTRGRRDISLLDSVANRSVSIKTSLCSETAKLLRFTRTRQRIGEQARDQYWISGFSVPDLRSINNHRCGELTTSLGVFSHFLVLIAFYLGVQLPAEITLPQRDYPFATIATPSISYTGNRKVFPGSGANMSGSGSNGVKQDKRPRPLFVGTDDENETVAQFAKKDPTAFSFFIEGISLLAWNVAWLSQTQGIGANSDSWTEACKIGRNLYRLVAASQRPPLLQRKPTTRDGRHQESAEQGDVKDAKVSLQMVHKSHASAYNFLTNNRTSLSPLKYTVISDSLRKALITQGKDAEWEVLGDDDFDDGAERFDEAVVVKNRALGGKDFDDARSIMTTRTYREDTEQVNGLRKGTSGWTKLKTRDLAL